MFKNAKRMSDKTNPKNEILNVVKMIEKQRSTAVRERFLYCKVLDQLQDRKKNPTEEENRMLLNNN